MDWEMVTVKTKANDSHYFRADQTVNSIPPPVPLIYSGFLTGQEMTTPAHDHCIKKKCLSSFFSSVLTSLINLNSWKKFFLKTTHSCCAPILARTKDNRVFNLHLMSFQTKPPGETTHIWQSRPVCESQRTQWHGEQTVPSVQLWHWTPHASAVSPRGCQHWPSLSHVLRHRTAEWAG